MQHFQPQNSQASVEVTPQGLPEQMPHSHKLLTHLQTALPNPLDLLLKPGLGSLLGNIETQQALPDEEVVVFKPTKAMLGQESRLSESMLWDMQAQFYQRLGTDAWQQSVPSFITSSAYIAESYAEMILAFVEDYFEHLDLSEPITIVEMGTGTGRFSHLLLRELESKLSSFSKYQAVRVRYIMSDFTDSSPQFWQNHARLSEFVEKGMLDFAVFNPVESDMLTLQVSGEVIAPGSLKNPVIAIANYFFDSIQQDTFRVESKVLKEGLVTLDRNLQGLDDLEAEPQLSEITPVIRYQDVQSDQYYADSRWNAILKHYRHTIRNGSILFPVGAFNVIRHLEALSNNRLVLISSDKAYTSVEEMTRFYQHEYARHDGAFSYMVNYDAIGQYFLNQNGHYFHTEGASHSVQTVCCMRLNEPDVRFERMDYLYRQKLNRANTINSVCAVMPGRMESMGPAGHVQQMISHIRLNLCDPQVFLMMGQQLVDALPYALHSQWVDIQALMEQTWQNYYYFPGEANIPFWFAQLYAGMGQYEKSNEALDQAMAFYGQHEALYFLKGQNYEQLQHWHNAKAAYECALVLKPEFPEATAALSLINSRLKYKP